MLNTEGKVLTCIKGDSIDYPLYSTMYKCSQELYILVSEGRKGNVVKLSLEGKLIAATPEGSFKGPRKPTVLQKGLVAVANFGTKEISIISVQSDEIVSVKQIDFYLKTLALKYSSDNRVIYSFNYDGDGIIQIWTI